MISPMSKSIKLSASILSADFGHLADQIALVEQGGVDWIHIDVMDGHFVPNLTMGPVVVRACRQATELPLDVHLMVDNPNQLLSQFAEAGASNLTVHAEVCPHLHRTLQAIKELGCRAGVALNPATPVAFLHDVIDMVDLVLIMTVNPGYSGQEFIADTVSKIAAARRLLDEHSSDAALQVDGGIGADTVSQVIQAGASVLVAASAIYLHPEGPMKGSQELRQLAEAAAV
jgi:ribulose-phosphate 3-epimerase